MEVHPPEHVIHSWRDFLVHMGTITLGLLIALGLEHLVEVAHQHHVLHTAEHNLQGEVRSNSSLLSNDEQLLDSTQHQLEQHLSALRAAQAHQNGLPDNAVHWQWDGPQSAAWDTARDEGAIGLMSYDQAASLTLVYTQQKIVEDQAALYMRDLYNSDASPHAAGPAHPLLPEVLSSNVEETERTLADLRLLRVYCLNLSRLYQNP